MEEQWRERPEDRGLNKGGKDAAVLGVVMDLNMLRGFLQRSFRPNRMRVFFETFGVTCKTKILDVGGSPHIWEDCPLRPDVTLVNTLADWPRNGFKLVYADATNLPFLDGSFDIAFSNSVIEHLGNWGQQERMAKEVRRVASHYFVQTPNFWFPVEPHYLAPFIHYLPRSLRRHAVRWVTPHGWTARPSREEIAIMVDEISLLSERQLRQLFPDGEIYREKVLGVTKSLAAYR